VSADTTAMRHSAQMTYPPRNQHGAGFYVKNAMKVAPRVRPKSAHGGPDSLEAAGRRKAGCLRPHGSVPAETRSQAAVATAILTPDRSRDPHARRNRTRRLSAACSPASPNLRRRTQTTCSDCRLPLDGWYPSPSPHSRCRSRQRWYGGWNPATVTSGPNATPSSLAGMSDTRKAGSVEYRDNVQEQRLRHRLGSQVCGAADPADFLRPIQVDHIQALERGCRVVTQALAIALINEELMIIDSHNVAYGGVLRFARRPDVGQGIGIFMRDPSSYICMTTPLHPAARSRREGRGQCPNPGSAALTQQPPAFPRTPAIPE
jgi:hypothetical protein